MVLSGLAAEIVQKKNTGIPPLKAVVCPCLCMLLFGRVHGGAATGPKKIAGIPPPRQRLSCVLVFECSFGRVQGGAAIGPHKNTTSKTDIFSVRTQEEKKARWRPGALRP